MLNLSLTIALLGLIPAFIAKNKGRNFFLWWLYGFSFFIIALIHSLLLKSGKECPFCFGNIHELATVCKYCKKTQRKEAKNEKV